MAKEHDMKFIQRASNVHGETGKTASHPFYVRFNSENGEVEAWSSADNTELLAYSHTLRWFEVHPDCCEMLKPQVGDIILPHKGGVMRVDEIGGDKFYQHRNGLPSHFLSAEHFKEIIQRNGKAFFMPELERERGLIPTS